MVIAVSSMAYILAETNTKNPNFNEGKDHHPWVAYGASNTANSLATIALKERYDRIVPLTIGPGMAHDSQLLVNIKADEELWTERKDVPQTVFVSMQQGVAPSLLAVLDPSLRDRAGYFFKECQITEPLLYTSGKNEALKLWELRGKLVGEKFAG
ncbi:hypothetical protein GQ43DRAFT_460531 [Delitschia confertaspora ATCC 74209]|uniref:Uncharacterized protein n=1 Tax=Delitschia confertaspora ATCC 74209 TaxID=1513339 RepID=A0A9P4JWG3_9PLEO|nr:hypothetical protein GQ43DRAFT_460531 [Delitschia confertaspora ATCC 74209]